MAAQEIVTRFRAYQLGQAGSSFSYFGAGKFTLIEARLNDVNRANIHQEMELCGKQFIDCLHITSWDQDHCTFSDLKSILETLKPKQVEYPGYLPESDNGKACQKAIENYEAKGTIDGTPVSCVCVNPNYINGLKSAEELGYRNVFYGPKIFFEKANDNSTVKVFREGCFNVASLGDVEDVNIGSRLRGCGIFKREIDILILAHHGADCPTNSKNFLERVRPQLAVCSSNYDNQFEHPRQDVRDRLFDLDIPIFTTKTGDIIAQSLPPHNSVFRVYNLISNSTKVSSYKDFAIKKHHFLSMNLDSLRNIYKSRPSYGR